MSLAEDVDLEEFITMKDDLSGADIKAVCTEAGLLALRERRMRVTKADFTEAREKVRSIRHHFLVTLRVPLTTASRFSTGRTRARPRDCTYRLLFCISYAGFVFMHGFSSRTRILLQDWSNSKQPN